MGAYESIVPQLEKIWLEAEAGDLTAPMQTGTDPEASSGEYIEVPNGQGDLDDPLLAGGFAAYDFTIPMSGEYVIWGRVLAAGNRDDSFYVAVDGGDYALWDVEQSGSWIWDQVKNRDGDDPVVYSLGAGDHSLVIKHREDGTRIDRILITSDPDYVPEG